MIKSFIFCNVILLVYSQQSNDLTCSVNFWFGSMWKRCSPSKMWMGTLNMVLQRYQEVSFVWRECHIYTKWAYKTDPFSGGVSFWVRKMQSGLTLSNWGTIIFSTYAQPSLSGTHPPPTNSSILIEIVSFRLCLWDVKDGLFVSC